MNLFEMVARTQYGDKWVDKIIEHKDNEELKKVVVDTQHKYIDKEVSNESDS